ncbi:hypothetical protein Lal_00020234 [Lupinus albus]|nr:hypothetical protein Lal_00020234 [Lupinus albus]
MSERDAKLVVLEFLHSITCVLPINPTLDGVEFSRLSDSQSSSLDAAFLEVEIKARMWSFASDKCPGLDGFNFKFLQSSF